MEGGILSVFRRAPQGTASCEQGSVGIDELEAELVCAIKRVLFQVTRAANNYWEKPETLAGHYADHGEGVGATSKEEYADMAHEPYLNKGLCQASVDKEGITRVYDVARNLFEAYSPDGMTRTLFAPPEASPTSTI